MQDTLRALQGLQDIDRHIFTVENELRRLPKELEARQEELQQKAQRLSEMRDVIAEVRKNIKEIDDITSQQRQRQRKLEGEAQKTSDGALIAAYQHEIRSLKRTISRAEEDGLGMIEKAEIADKDSAELEASLASDQTDFEAFQANVEKETAQAEARLAELRAELAKLSSESVQPEHLALYRRLLETREGEAMSELDGRYCQGCYVEIPKNLAVRLARGIELVQCNSCDRILFIR